MKRIYIIIFIALLSSSLTYARENLRTLFKNNAAIIYTINIRNFAAIDSDSDGIINTDKKDTMGNFVLAKEKLKDLKDEGINTIYLLPITKTGKLKALGTLGSLYSLDSFSEIDPVLDYPNNDLSAEQEACAFIDEAHKLDMNVILDLPCCGSFDLSIKKPSLFALDKNKKTLTPADWTDVRIFKVLNDDKTLNKQTLLQFKSFIDLALLLNADGIRADVAAIKPKEFWVELINYTRSKNPDFLFLAEASPLWSNPAKSAVSHYCTIEELLSSGFDSYYGSWSDFETITTKQEFDNRILSNLRILNRYKDSSIISALATHDQRAPILKGFNYWNMVLWLSVTLPQNTYFLDGFSVGDDFIYPYENKKADKTYTDDEYYFVHSGLFDIFNPTAPIREKHPEFKKIYLKAIDFKQRNQDLITKGDFKLLKTNNNKVFAYSITTFDRELIVIGSLDDNKNQSAVVKSNYLNKDYLKLILSAKKHPKIDKNLINVELEPREIQVYLISLAKYRAM